MLLRRYQAQSELSGDNRAGRKWRRRRRGLTAIEYCFMLSLIMLAVLFAVQHLGNTLKASFQASDTKMSSYMPGQ
jgi:Flp pilus assembly pilin Flp